jgi:hypothetical protein
MNPVAVDMGPTMKGTNTGPPRAKGGAAPELSASSPVAAIAAGERLSLRSSLRPGPRRPSQSGRDVGGLPT